jgi:uncharacterized phage protein gp47/JayE
VYKLYEAQTAAAIKQRMLDVIPSDLDKREGSFNYDALSPAAIELALSYIELDRVISLGFAQTTYGQYLDYRAGEHGLTRKAATKAAGQVTITGSNGTVVSAGSLFSTGAGIQFATTTQVTIGVGGTVTADIEAVLAGANGNVPGATITAIPVSIPGVTAVTNANPITGGTDTESDTDLLDRLLERVQNPPTSGNAGHYMQWAKEVSGIGDAKVFPIWNGNGTVKVVVIDSIKQPASADLVQDVTDYIEANRPIGATVTVLAATGVTINVSADVTLESGYTLAQVQTAAQASITDYLKSIAFVKNEVSYAIIGSLILDAEGVSDYQNYTINGGTTNVAVAADAVAVLGTVTIT